MSFPRYPKYKPSGIEWLGDVPEKWQRTRIQFLLLSGKDGIRIGPFGSSVKLEDMVPNGFKVFGQENVIYRDFSLGDRFISESKFLELAEYEIKSGDVLVTMAGTAGRCQVVPKEITRGIMDSHLVRMRFQQDQWPHLIPYLIEETKYVIDQLVVAGRGTTMHGLNSTVIKNVEVCLPPLDDQRQIASFLDRETGKIDELVAEQRRLIELLKEKRQAVISHAVIKGLNPHAPLKPSGIQWLGDVPAAWTVTKLGRVAFMQEGPGLRNWQFTDGGTRVICVTNITESGIDFSRLEKFISTNEYNSSYRHFTVQPGDVLLSSSGNSWGKVAIYEGDEDVMLNTSTIRLNEAEGSPLIRGFLAMLLQSITVREQLGLAMTGSCQPNFGPTHLSSVVVAVPSRDEQSQIITFVADKAARFDALTTEAERTIELLKERRTALISATVTGKIDVCNFAPSEATL